MYFKVKKMFQSKNKVLVGKKAGTKVRLIYLEVKMMHASFIEAEMHQIRCG